MVIGCKRKSPAPTPARLNTYYRRFFKVYLPDRSSHQLKIPTAFVKRFSGVLPQSAILSCSRKRSWSVDVKKLDGELSFQNGWHNFVEDTSLESGDFLVFSYLGSSRFSVRIYGKNCCEKDYAYAEEGCNINNDGDEAISDKCYKQEFGHGEQIREVQIENEDMEQFTLKDLAISLGNQKKRDGRKNKCGVKKRPTGSRHHTREQHRAFVPTDKAREAARNCKSEHPHFKIGILPVYLDHGSLNIPMPFAEKYLKPGRLEIDLQFLDKSWPVTLTTYSNGCCKISSGWLAFVRDNSVEEGDICLFELIDRRDFSLKVSIFR